MAARGTLPGSRLIGTSFNKCGSSISAWMKDRVRYLLWIQACRSSRDDDGLSAENHKGFSHCAV